MHEVEDDKEASIYMKLNLILILLIFLAACNNNTGPDVSGVPVDISIHRFDKFLFEKVDTNDMPRAMKSIEQQYPFFADDFFSNILGLPRLEGMAIDSTSYSFSEVKRFLKLTRPLYDSLAPRFNDTHELENQLKRGFQHVKYYYKSYEVPQVVTYIGPFDAPAVAITRRAMAIGLQLYGGKNFSFYTSRLGQELYPAYISRRFEPEYIPANCMTAVVEDLYPDRAAGKPLIEQMITKGKQWWLLDKFMPATSDTLKTGYTKKQVDWCNENEGLIWNFFLQNDLYTTEPIFIKNYIGEAPTTEGMPQASPGNIGQWVGWQIVKAYAANHADLNPDAIMKTDPKVIFKESKYKPR
jgi:hypothetical protein